MSGTRKERYECKTQGREAGAPNLNSLDFTEWRQLPVERRTFLSLSAAVSASVTFAAYCPLTMGSSVKTQGVAISDLRPEWVTLAAVQNHLFPVDGDGPGAEDINADGYLRLMLADPKFDSEERDFIFNGVRWLNDLTQSTYQEDFHSLIEPQKEMVLGRIARSRAGENWLATLLRYIFEALLSDPVYGGNPDQIGWKWLEHQPGFPRPSEEKRYFLL